MFKFQTLIILPLISILVLSGTSAHALSWGGKWKTINKNHRLIYLEGNRLLDWVPKTGEYRLWHINRQFRDKDPLKYLITTGKFTAIKPHHELIYLGNNVMLAWDRNTSTFDTYQISSLYIPFFSFKFSTGYFHKAKKGDRLIYLGRNRMMVWNPKSGKYGVFQLYPTRLTTPFGPILSSGFRKTGHPEYSSTYRVKSAGSDHIVEWNKKGHYQFWEFDEKQSIAWTSLSKGDWSTISHKHDLVYIGYQWMLDISKNGAYRIFEIDYDEEDPLVKLPSILLGPVLMFPLQKKVSVWWHTSTEEGSHYLLLDTDPSLKTSSKIILTQKTDYPKIDITNLAPNKKYYYQIHTKGSFSKVRSFKTVPPPHAPFRISIWGDNQHGKKIFKNYTVPALINSNPDFLLSLGDVVQKGHKYSHWKKQLYLPAANLLSQFPWFPVRGNHDGISSLARKMMPMPRHGYYAFSQGPMRIIVLNTEMYYKPRSRQFKWLAKQVRSPEWKNALYRVVCFHRLPFTQLWNGRDYNGERRVRKYIIPLLENSGTDIILNGHAHSYQYGKRRTKYGYTHYFTFGGGGGELDEEVHGNWSFIKKVESRYHIGIVDVSKEQAVFTALDTKENKIIHRVVVPAREPMFMQ